MKTKLFILFLIVLLVSPVLSNNRDKSRVDKSTYGLPNENNSNVVFSSTKSNIITPELSGSFRSGDVIIGPEVLTENTGWYDYMTNGDCRHYIQVDKSNSQLISVIYTISSETDPPGATSRRTVYAYSTNGGTNWNAAGNVPNDTRTGFGYMILKPTGEALVSMHAGSPVNSQLHVDVAPQAATWNSYNAPLPARIWPQISIMTNNNVLIVANQNTTSPPDSLVFAIFNGTAISNWSPVVDYNPVSNQRWASSSGANGNAIIISNPVSITTDTLGSNFIRAYTTTNNGSSFSGPEFIFRPFVQGSDTITAFFGQDVIYKPGTTDWYFAVNAVGTRFRSARLYMIRKNNLTPVVIADSTNVPVLTNQYKTFAGIIGIDHPSLGWSEDGNILYCAYTVAVEDTGSRGWNTRDVFYSASTNNGDTWLPPVRITNTPTIDEGYASISQWNKGTSPSTYELHIQYMKDPGDGPTAFNGTAATAPATLNQQIYRKITEAAPIGINSISNEIPFKFNLEQNYPNPFNPVTKIRFSVPKTADITLEVFDVTGQLISTIINNVTVTAGFKEVEFNAVNLPSGVYFYSIKSGNYSETKKMVLIK